MLRAKAGAFRTDACIVRTSHSSPMGDLVMRFHAAILFTAIAGVALVARVIEPQRALEQVASLPAYAPSLSSPFLVRVPKNEAAFPSLSLARPAPEAEPVPVPAPAPDRQLTIVLAGDTGLNGSFQTVHAGFAFKHGSRLSFEEATPGIAGLINGDVNFANLETVVTDRNDLPASLKMFGFRTHPDGVRELLRIGFNVFSTANNHAMDYGSEGARETIRQLDALGVVHAGLGFNRAAAASARVIERRGVRVAFGALGIGGSGFGSLQAAEERPGQLTVSERDLSEVTASLAASKADYRVLSAHYGTEFDVTTSSSDRRRFAEVLRGGADMVVGHHQHVAAGIEIVEGKPVFYGLGNFLHWGTQDMGRHDMCHDYGVVARVHLSGRPGERLSVKAIEAVPVTGMHLKPRRLDAVASTERVQALNYLNRQFGEQGVRFAVEADGTGLYCAAGADRLTGEIGSRCAANPGYKAPAPALETRIAAACAKRVVRIVEEVPEEAAPVQVGMLDSSVSAADVSR